MRLERELWLPVVVVWALGTLAVSFSFDMLFMETAVLLALFWGMILAFLWMGDMFDPWFRSVNNSVGRWFLDSTAGEVILGILVNLLLVVVVVSLWNVVNHRFFDMAKDATAGEYRAASGRRQLRYLNRICGGVGCVSRQDGACGFVIEDIDAEQRIVSCFLDRVKSAAPGTPLDALVEGCARPMLVFAGESSASPQECRKAGGRWGEIGNAPERNLTER